MEWWRLTWYTKIQSIWFMGKIVVINCVMCSVFYSC